MSEGEVSTDIGVGSQQAGGSEESGEKAVHNMDAVIERVEAHSGKGPFSGVSNTVKVEKPGKGVPGATRKGGHDTFKPMTSEEIKLKEEEFLLKKDSA